MATAQQSAWMKPKKRRHRFGRHAKNPQMPSLLQTPLSLPPADTEPATASPPSPPLVDPSVPEGGKQHLTALKIVAFRAAGMTDEEIATTLGLSRSSLSRYVYRAARNGFLDFDRPQDRLEYQVLHKVVRNLDEALDSQATLQTGMPVRHAVALKVGEGTLFKQWAEPVAPSASTMVAIRIEMPTASGTPTQIREGTTGGAPAFIEGDTTEARHD